MLTRKHKGTQAMPWIETTINREVRAARATLKPYGFSTLLAPPDSNPKIAKGLAQGVMTAPLHLAPADLSGWNVCPMATLGCKAACLHTAGNPAAMAGKDRARKARTRAFFEQRAAFMVTLANEIHNLNTKARKAGMICAVRLNATSDIRWEREPVTLGGVTYANMMQLFSDVVFYDYTKIANRRNVPSNYKLTFSLAENNDAHASVAFNQGFNVAVVFDVKRGKPLPDTFTICDKAYRVIDGDESDARFADPRGVVIGLRAKGKAIGDTSGFVRAAA